MSKFSEEHKKNLWQRWLVYSRSKAVRTSLLFLVVFLLALLVEGSRQGVASLLRFSPYNTAYVVVELTAILDPVGTLPMFLMFVSGVEKRERRKVVQTMTTVVMALLLFFALLGKPLLGLLGIGVPSFEFGGGIILLFLAIDMLGSESTHKIDLSQVAVVPLATPLLVGPGTLTALVVLTNQPSISVLDVLVGCVVASLIVFMLFYFSDYLFTLLGENGVKAVSRLFTIILAAIAAQMIHNALLSWGLAKA